MPDGEIKPTVEQEGERMLPGPAHEEVDPEQVLSSVHLAINQV
jgi:hypothetical protein